MSHLYFPTCLFCFSAALNTCHRMRTPWTVGCAAQVLTCDSTFLVLGILRTESQAVETNFPFLQNEGD